MSRSCPKGWTRRASSPRSRMSQRTGDDRVRAELQMMLGETDPVKVSVSQNLMEIASMMNIIHKVVRHYYLSGKKTNSYLTLIQLQMSLPQIMEEVDALVQATDTFHDGATHRKRRGPDGGLQVHRQFCEARRGEGYGARSHRVQGQDALYRKGQGTHGLRG